MSGDNERGRKEMPSAVEQGGPTTDTKTPNTNDTGSSFLQFFVLLFQDVNLKPVVLNSASL